MKAPRRPARSPLQRPELTPGEHAALRAVARGEADGFQQRLAIEVIRTKIAGEDLISFWPGGEDGRRASDFAEGKRFVGKTIGFFARREGPVDLRDDPPAMPDQPKGD